MAEFLKDRSAAEQRQGEEARVVLVRDFDRDTTELQEVVGEKKTQWFAVELATMLEERIDARENFTASGVLTLKALPTYEKRGIPARDLQPINKWYDLVLDLLASGNTEHIPPLSLSHGHFSFAASHTPSRDIDKTKKCGYDEIADRTAGQERHGPLMSPLPQQEPPMGTQIDRRHVLSVVLKDASSVLRNLSALNSELTEVQKPIVKKTQQYLESLEGYSFGSLEANKDVATEIQLLLNRLGYWVQCPRSDCDQPAVLECRPAGGSKNGTFQFRHLVNGKQANHSGSTKLPKLGLVPSPPDRRRRKRK